MSKRPTMIQWTGKRQFIGTDSGNHSIVISSHDSDNHTGMKPSELMLLALGSCSGYDIVSILQKKRVGLREMRIEISSEQDPDPPWTFRKIHMVFYLQGERITEKAARQAVKLSITKYCSVAATLSGKAEITFDINLDGSHGDR
ncbi:MAG: OsmC family protein [Anaerolineales bacterium]|nr:OsmC family protein [Anaerolineales bacterium]